MFHRPASFRSSASLNTDMGDVPSGRMVTAILKATGETVRVELFDTDHDAPLVFFGAERNYFADQFDGWLDEADEAGLLPAYDFDRFALYDEPQIGGSRYGEEA